MSNQIFDKERRIRAHVKIHQQSMMTPENTMAFEYLKALEDLAQITVAMWDQGKINEESLPGLRSALQKVDWMRV